MVIVFDLDDTLYQELAFVQSGFQAVADYLSPILKLDRSMVVEGLEKELMIKRAGVFNRFLSKYECHTQRLVKRCLSVYRGHEPRLKLFPEAYACLARLQNYPLYIVTDGNHLVQRKKFLALGLETMVKRCFFTYAHGLRYSKPSPYCFEKICQLEKVSPASVVYIADNPYKDFVGIKPLGFQTVRVLTGCYRNDRVDDTYEAQFIISNLDAFDEAFLQKLRNSSHERY